MNKRTRHKLEVAKAAVVELFCDASGSREETLAAMKELYEEVEARLVALSDEISPP